MFGMTNALLQVKEFRSPPAPRSSTSRCSSGTDFAWVLTIHRSA
jgi:hypothetical protein